MTNEYLFNIRIILILLILTKSTKSENPVNPDCLVKTNVSESNHFNSYLNKSILFDFIDQNNII